MKTIAIMQPVYLPWLGYFEQMAICDEFMFLDDVQYTKHDWRNRNRIRNKDGWMWLTIPIKKLRLSQTLQEAVINYQKPWITKQLNALQMNYSPTPFFDEIFNMMNSAFEKRPIKLIDLTIPLIQTIAKYLNIHTPISFASDIPRTNTDKHNRIIELCHARSAQLLYTGVAAKAYMDLDYLKSNGVIIQFQDYQHPLYRQHFSGFESHMAIIDLLMNHGQQSRDILLSSPLPNHFNR